jgi:hypothetical protein
VEAIRQSEERYRTVVDALAEGVVVQDAEGTVLDLSGGKRGSGQFGLGRVDLEGDHPAVGLPGRDGQPEGRVAGCRSRQWSSTDCSAPG